jgi:hypothetical protein
VIERVEQREATLDLVRLIMYSRTSLTVTPLTVTCSPLRARGSATARMAPILSDSWPPLTIVVTLVGVGAKETEGR